jgi:hypothetical protein
MGELRARRKHRLRGTVIDLHKNLTMRSANYRRGQINGRNLEITIYKERRGGRNTTQIEARERINKALVIDVSGLIIDCLTLETSLTNDQFTLRNITEE